MATAHPLEQVEAEPPARTGKQWLVYPAGLVLLILVPLTIAFTVSAPASTTVTLIALAIISIGVGLFDAVTFRPTLGLPISLAFFFFLTHGIFYNSGAWIYGIGVGSLVWLSSTITAWAGLAGSATVQGKTEG